MKRTIERVRTAAILAVTCLLFVAGNAWADFEKTNPVTGETENYTWKFVGTNTWNGTQYWQNSSGANPSSVPAKTGENTWDPILFDGNTINIQAGMSVEGWNLRMGLYNGANVRLNTFVKWQGDTTMWVTVDDTSKFTVGGFGKGNIANNQVVKCSTTRQNGIEWLVNLESTGNANNTFEYYLKGAGSVSYQAVSAANHKIRMADVTLSGGAKSVQSKTLVSFTSTDKTFTADATIKVKDGDDVLKNVYLTSVTADATTLTTEADVGTCELVQTSTGIDLYWVDGNPADLPAAAVYKPSININFTDSGNGLTTGADVGLTDYEVPGTSWNNFVAANATYSTVNAVDATGEASVLSGVSVTISGTRGSYSCSGLTAASNPLHGYIDENDSNMTPTVTVSGIPYYKYRVLVYHSTDSANVPFGYDTINGTNYTYDNGALTEGTSAWGDSGASNNANAISEGGNVLLTGELSGSTLTVVGHRAGGDSSARGCIAAIQIIEVKPEVGENDLEIPVSGDTTYTVSEAKTLSGTVYLTGNGTLTLDGDAKITAATIDVGLNVTLNVNADRLDATTFTGCGTVVYTGAVPPTGKGWTNSEWLGTVWIKNYGTGTGSLINFNDYGNSLSTVRTTGVVVYFPSGAQTCAPAVELVDEQVNDTTVIALTVANGSGSSTYSFSELKGSGTLKGQGTGGANANSVHYIRVLKWSSFTGSIDTETRAILFTTNTANSGTPWGSATTWNKGEGTIYVDTTAGDLVAASGATWKAKRFVVNGTLYANGALAVYDGVTTAVTGTGTVVFTGSVPTNTGDAWWKNAAWTGTVWLKNASIAALDSNLYGNSESTLKFTNVTGYFEQNHVNTVPIELDGDGFYYNNGWGGELQKFSELKGSGLFKTGNAGNGGTIWVKKYSSFSGAMTLAYKKVVLGGSEPTHPNTNWGGQLVIADDSQIATIASGKTWGISSSATIDGTLAVNGFIWASGGITVNGTFKAADRDKWGGGTAMTLGDTGVLELTSTANNEDYADYSGVTGTGTIKYSSTAGWRLFPSDDAKMPATTLTIQTELADSLIITKDNSGETVIGNLAGSKNIRSDWNAVNAGDNSRTFTVTQSKDTEWQGKFVNNRITQFNVNAPAEGTAGTLTLSGTHTETIPMQVNGSVNLTGTWVGATTVAGTIGGTGTVTGNLTFSAGSTFKAFASDEDGLSVSGTVVCPAEGTVTVDVDALGSPESDVVLISKSGLEVSKFALKSGTPANYTLKVEDNALKLKVPVTVTVPAIANTTVTVTVGGDTIGTSAGNYDVAAGSVVTVTYAAASGYQISGTTEYTIDTASATTFDPSSTTQVAQIVARVIAGEVTTNYTSLQAAFDAVANNNRIILLASTEDGATIPSSAMQFYFYAGDFECGTIADATGDFVTTKTDATIEIDEVEVTAKKYRVSAAVAVVTIPNEGASNFGDYMTAYTAFVNGPVGTTMRVIGENPFSTDISCTAYDSETQTYTKLAAVASITTVVMTVEYPSLADAVDAAEAGQTVALLDNITLTATVAIDKTLTLDLNGHAITASDYIVLTDRAVTLTVSHGTLSPAPTTSVEGAKVKLIDGTYKVVYGTIFLVY